MLEGNDVAQAMLEGGDVDTGIQVARALCRFPLYANAPLGQQQPSLPKTGNDGHKNRLLGKVFISTSLTKFVTGALSV